jgi:DMSO/TMAO reductase YedYZ heme-binding membrane subunit
MERRRVPPIWILLIALVLFVQGGTLVPLVRAHYLDLSIDFAVLAAAFLAFHRRWVDFGLAAFFAVVFLAARLVFVGTEQTTLALRTFSVSAYVLLHVVLLIGPWAKLSRSFQKRFFRYRRRLGVLAYFLASAHFGLAFATAFGYSFSLAFLSVYPYYGFVSYLILLAMALTSWDWVQMRISRAAWTLVHVGMLAAFLWTTWYFRVTLGIEGVVLPAWHWWLFALFLLLWALVAPWGFARDRVRHLWGWKHLHMLVYVAYVSVVVHAWTGTLQYEPLWERVLFWALFGTVVGSHALGYIVRFVRGRRRVSVDKTAF